MNGGNNVNSYLLHGIYLINHQIVPHVKYAWGKHFNSVNGEKIETKRKGN